MRPLALVLTSLFLALPPAGAETSPHWLLPVAHYDALPVTVKVEGGSEVKGQLDRFVISHFAGTLCTFVALHGADIICKKQFGGPNFMPLDYWAVAVAGGVAIRLGFEFFGGPTLVEAEKSESIKPNEERFSLAFANPGDAKLIRHLLGRDPYLESTETQATYRALAIELNATLGTREAIPGSREEGFSKSDRWYLQTLMVTQVRIVAREIHSENQETLELSQFTLGKSCRSWIVRLARLLF